MMHDGKCTTNMHGALSLECRILKGVPMHLNIYGIGYYDLWDY